MTPVSVLAYEITDQLAVEATGTVVVQYADFDDAVNADGTSQGDTARGTAVTDIGFVLAPTEVDEFNVVVSFATGNALNALGALTLAPYADDLEDDPKDNQ